MGHGPHGTRERSSGRGLLCWSGWPNSVLPCRPASLFGAAASAKGLRTSSHMLPGWLPVDALTWKLASGMLGLMGSRHQATEAPAQCKPKPVSGAGGHSKACSGCRQPPQRIPRTKAPSGASPSISSCLFVSRYPPSNRAGIFPTGVEVISCGGSQGSLQSSRAPGNHQSYPHVGPQECHTTAVRLSGRPG